MAWKRTRPLAFSPIKMTSMDPVPDGDLKKTEPMIVAPSCLINNIEKCRVERKRFESWMPSSIRTSEPRPDRYGAQQFALIGREVPPENLGTNLGTIGAERAPNSATGSA